MVYANGISLVGLLLSNVVGKAVGRIILLPLGGMMGQIDLMCVMEQLKFAPVKLKKIQRNTLIFQI